jgi:predicted negative regulator of RcsB-dependent stress response
VGTTKLTRKEILAEDPIHDAILRSVEYVRVQGSKVAAIAAGIVILAFGIYGGIRYIEKKRSEAQYTFAKGLEYFHADVTAGAAANPQGKDPGRTFPSETAKYQAAAKEFAPVASSHINGKLAILARYYLGLTQLQLNQKKEAMQNLESVAGNSSNRTLGFLAKKAIAMNDVNSGNNKEAQQLLSGIIKDPQCDLRKEDLTIQLSRVLVAQGNREEAIKVLREASAQNPFGKFKPQLTSELEKLQKSPKSGTEAQPAHP